MINFLFFKQNLNFFKEQNFDFFLLFFLYSKKKRKSKLLIGTKIVLVAIIIIKLRMVAIIEARRGLPSLKMLISRPSDAQEGCNLLF